MKKYSKTISKVDMRYKRAHIRGANIPVDLIIGLGVKEVKEMYPWLKDDQIEDALEYIKECVTKQSSAIYKKHGAPSETQVQTV